MTKTAPLRTPSPAPPAVRARTGLLLAGATTVAAGAVQADGGILTQAYRGASPVADERLTFPWEGATAVATTLTWGITQLMLVGALLVFARSGAVGPGRAGRTGAALAVAGGAAFVGGHALTLLFLDAVVDDPVGVAVIAVFAVGGLLNLVGFLMAGIATLRAGRWSSWRRFTPLAVAAGMVAVMPLQFTPLLPLSVAVYSAGIVALGLAMVFEGAESR